MTPEVTAAYTGPRIYALRDVNAEGHARAAFSWALWGATSTPDMEQERFRLMDREVNELDDEAVTAAVVACTRLMGSLGRRTAHLRGMAQTAAAVLTPDALPDGVDGYPISGRTS